MLSLAVILFPGLNTENETCREIERAGMKAVKFRWNESPEKLRAYSGYVIGGGFSYEDRGRAGIIASLDPIMSVIKEEAAKGKPVLGICNGAQILVEAGLIPGADGNKLALALARNKRADENGKILGTGYYNAWTQFKCTVPAGQCMFTWDIPEGTILSAPIAHCEGRYTTENPDLMLALKENDQMVFRYCDSQGVMNENFPVNPNGAMFNVAALCNPAGNVMAVMPHLERAAQASHMLFSSLKKAMEAQNISPAKKNKKLSVKELPTYPLPPYKPASSRTVEFLVSLIITDNENETYLLALAQLGFSDVKLSRVKHVEIEYKGKPAIEALIKKLILSGLLLNTNKEAVCVKIGKKMFMYDAKKQKLVKSEKPEAATCIIKNILVRERPDFVGMSKLQTATRRFGIKELINITTGTLWTLQLSGKSENAAETELKKILATHLFFNPHGQTAMAV